MRILLDECAPRRLQREFPGHDVRTGPEMGWSGKKNGELIQLMSAHGFEVLLTVDQNLRYQQNLKNARMAVIVMIGMSNRFADLMSLVPAVQAALRRIAPGDILEITA